MHSPVSIPTTSLNNNNSQSSNGRDSNTSKESVRVITKRQVGLFKKSSSNISGSDSGASLGLSTIPSRRHRKTHPDSDISDPKMSASSNSNNNNNNNMNNDVGTKKLNSRFPDLKIDTSPDDAGTPRTTTPATATSTASGSYSFPSTPHNNSNLTNGSLRGQGDVRSPGEKATPMNANIHQASVGMAMPPMNAPTNLVGEKNSKNDLAQDSAAAATVPIPDFITQTDKYGNATTPRNPIPPPGGSNPDENHDHSNDAHTDDPCDALLESFRMMCCCLLSDEKATTNTTTSSSLTRGFRNRNGSSRQYRQKSHMSGSARQKRAPMLLPTDPNDPNRVKLLPKIHPDDEGKKCLVLDLDETLVHSSFRAVPGADFVIPVQIEEVVHFVYVTKRPGVDAFLLEMAKYYEIVVYTASLNKYADPLLDLLDPHRVIRTRLFRESCVYFEGNYVKDMSLIDRDLSQSIIVDNSPNSYLFHPENAIGCSSFIDDPMDRELVQIGGFLKNIRDAEDVRGICSLWKNWPDVDLSSVKRMEEPKREDKER